MRREGEGEVLHVGQPVALVVGESYEACELCENFKFRDIRQMCAICQISGIGQILDILDILGSLHPADPLPLSKNPVFYTCTGISAFFYIGDVKVLHWNSSAGRPQCKSFAPM